MVGKTLKFVRFMDIYDAEAYYDDVFFSELSKYELQKKVEEIVESFEKSGFNDWTFKDIVKELKKQNLIEEPDFGVDWCDIYV